MLDSEAQRGEHEVELGCHLQLKSREGEILYGRGNP